MACRVVYASAPVWFGELFVWFDSLGLAVLIASNETPGCRDGFIGRVHLVKRSTRALVTSPSTNRSAGATASSAASRPSRKTLDPRRSDVTVDQSERRRGVLAVGRSRIKWAGFSFFRATLIERRRL